MRAIQVLGVSGLLFVAAGCGTPGSDRAAADRALEDRLRGDLRAYGDLASVEPNVQISAVNGTVTLTGHVPSEKDRQMVDAMVRNSGGVFAVNDLLDVTYTPTGAAPPARIYSAPVVISPAPAVSPPTTVLPGETAMVRVQASKEIDEPVAHEVADQIRYTSIPASWLSTVTITVTDGAVYLQGYIDNDTERHDVVSAIQHAPGVRVVYDQMQKR